MYQDLIHKLAPGINPAGVEASMRLVHNALDGLSEDDFRLEIELAQACEREQPGFLRSAASSIGLLADFERWERLT